MKLKVEKIDKARISSYENDASMVVHCANSWTTTGLPQAFLIKELCRWVMSTMEVMTKGLLHSTARWRWAVSEQVQSRA